MTISDLMEMPKKENATLIDSIVRAAVASKSRTVIYPRMKLYCDDDHCQMQTFHSPDEALTHIHGVHYETTCFTCDNCRKGMYLFAMAYYYLDDNVYAQKIGQIPEFKMHLSAKFRRIMEPWLLYLRKGYQCEQQGLGIAAMAYYRRILEESKTDLLKEIRKLAVLDESDQEVLNTIDSAIRENRFSAALDSVKSHLPARLYFKGQSGLTILHSSYSAGLHSETDEECLENCRNFRFMLLWIVERIVEAKDDHAELARVISKANSKKAKIEKS